MRSFSLAFLAFLAAGPACVSQPTDGCSRSSPGWCAQLLDHDDVDVPWNEDQAVSNQGDGVRLEIAITTIYVPDESRLEGLRMSAASAFRDHWLRVDDLDWDTEVEAITDASGTVEYELWLREMPTNESGELLDARVGFSIASDAIWVTISASPEE